MTLHIAMLSMFLLIQIKQGKKQVMWFSKTRFICRIWIFLGDFWDVLLLGPSIFSYAAWVQLSCEETYIHFEVHGLYLSLNITNSGVNHVFLFVPHIFVVAFVYFPGKKEENVDSEACLHCNSIIFYIHINALLCFPVNMELVYCLFPFGKE